jgi:hypothetical protein
LSANTGVIKRTDFRRISWQQLQDDQFSKYEDNLISKKEINMNVFLHLFGSLTGLELIFNR